MKRLLFLPLALLLALVQAAPSALKGGTTAKVGIWNVTAGKRPVVSRSVIGNEFLSLRADSGYSFVLVPVSLQNTSNKTDGLFFVSWKLQDDRGLVYEVHGGADLYLDEASQLNLNNVPPGATRSGYLVFQVKAGAKNLYLTIETTLGSKTWVVK